MVVRPLVRERLDPGSKELCGVTIGAQRRLPTKVSNVIAWCRFNPQDDENDKAAVGTVHKFPEMKMPDSFMG